MYVYTLFSTLCLGDVIVYWKPGKPLGNSSTHWNTRLSAEWIIALVQVSEDRESLPRQTFILDRVLHSFWLSFCSVAYFSESDIHINKITFIWMSAVLHIFTFRSREKPMQALSPFLFVCTSLCLSITRLNVFLFTFYAKTSGSSFMKPCKKLADISENSIGLYRFDFVYDWWQFDSCFKMAAICMYDVNTTEF